MRLWFSCQRPGPKAQQNPPRAVRHPQEHLHSSCPAFVARFPHPPRSLRAAQGEPNSVPPAGRLVEAVELKLPSGITQVSATVLKGTATTRIPVCQNFRIALQDRPPLDSPGHGNCCGSDGP